MEEKNQKRVMRRLYSLYPEHVAKLEQLARLRKMPQSQYLREMIDIAYMEAFKKSVTTYGQDA